MPKYSPTIGLEIHTELNTATKMFCQSRNDPDEERPNVNVCPICMGHPGSLPAINEEAVRKVLIVGLALRGTLADYTEFDRKNYFYPDLPKGYQISQYKHPLVEGGFLEGVSITRVHLEEDTARAQHSPAGDFSLLDYNRAGVPLMELVTEPVIGSAEHAARFAKELQLLLRALGVSKANMEKGEMRIEANISLREDAGSVAQGLGTKVEVKNLNSIRAVRQAIEYEVVRQKKILDSGEKVLQETRGWDEKKQQTFSQRKKEESHDYRYFPEPDLPKLVISGISKFTKENLEQELNELPALKRVRYREKFGIKEEDIELYISNKKLADFFEATAGNFIDNQSAIKRASNYITSDLIGLSRSEGDLLEILDTIGSDNFSKLISMLECGELNSRGAKDILKIIAERGANPQEIAKEMGLLQEGDEEELFILARRVVEVNPKSVDDFKAGKQAALQYLIGQAMKESKGRVNPEVISKALLETIKLKGQ